MRLATVATANVIAANYANQPFVDKWSGTNNKLVFQETLLGLLFTGYSVREICRKLEINPKTFYDHPDHIASRCRRKLAMFDARW